LSAAARSARRGDASWDLLLVCVAGYMFIAVGRVHQLFPQLQALHPAILTGLGAIGLYVIDRRDSRRLDRLWVPTTRYLLALAVWMVLSIPGGLRPGNSFDMVFDNFIKTCAMYFVLAGSVRGTRDVERLALAYFLSATVYAFVVLTRFDVSGGGGDAWRLGRLYYYDANDFAAFAVSAMPFGLYFARAGRSTLITLLATGGLIVLTMSFVRSGSRGGFVALVFMGAYVVARYSAIALRWRLSAVAIVVLVLAGTASDEYWRQMSTILSDTDYNQTSESGRVQIWRRGMGYMLQHPILGVGVNNFGVAEGTLSPMAERQQYGAGVRWNAPHNSFVQVGAELGVPGLILFITIIATAFMALARRRRPSSVRIGPHAHAGELGQALTASLIGFVVGAFFLSLAYSEMLYTLVALAVAFRKVTDAPFVVARGMVRR
jgi:probable O-glycosylation ligase (exosortase A-associated)